MTTAILNLIVGALMPATLTCKTRRAGRTMKTKMILALRTFESEVALEELDFAGRVKCARRIVSAIQPHALGDDCPDLPTHGSLSAFPLLHSMPGTAARADGGTIAAGGCGSEPLIINIEFT